MQYFEYFDVHFVELNEVIKWTFVSSYKVTCLPYIRISHY